MHCSLDELVYVGYQLELFHFLDLVESLAENLPDNILYKEKRVPRVSNKRYE